MVMAAMNMIPPIVGVPCLDMCQDGPISLIDCPAFNARRAGTRNQPITAVSARAIIPDQTLVIGRFLRSLSFVPYHTLLALYPRPGGFSMVKCHTLGLLCPSRLTASHSGMPSPTAQANAARGP